jgi:Na+(H+)/acetate symporter ActP
MAIGADRISAASFVGPAGDLCLQGYSGLAFIMRAIAATSCAAT